MFNTVCWWLNVLGLPFVAAWMRRVALRAMASHARVWRYGGAPVAGYVGGVDVPLFGTVAFIPWVEGGRIDVPYVYQW